MRCFTVSLTTCAGVCSRFRTRRRAYWRAPGDATTFTSSVALALAAGEATGRLQTGHYRLPVVARRNVIVPRGRLPAYRWLRTALSSLGWRQCPHFSANQHSAWRQELFGGRLESMEQSSRQTATTRRRTRTVQTSFKDIFVLRGCSALVTISAFNALCINLLTHSLTHSQYTVYLSNN